MADSIINLLGADIFSWVIVPLLIICARIFDVTFGTIRIILISKGYQSAAPFIGFFEIFIWIIAVSQIMQHLDRWIYYIAYALGYALGTFIGMKIENKLSLGQVVLRIITPNNSEELIQCLKDNNYNFTIVDAHGKFGPVKIIFMITQRHLLNKTVKLIETLNPTAFYSVEDIRFVKGSLPGGDNPLINTLKNPFTKNMMFQNGKRK